MGDDARTDPERLRRVSALLDVALALPEGEREGWLCSLPAPEQPLAPLLRGMLARAADTATDDFMRVPASAGLDELFGPPEPEDRSGDSIGPYRLVSELGAGGMATVWLAERRDGTLQRQVALKLPRHGWAQGLARRMARERDILASLEHPLIARLYDAGVTDNGRPWLAMERVAGMPIDLHCRERRLGVAQRLRLFLQVADAVAYAHAHLVVHRDLKPGNILVTPQGQVRLLDFGVAALLGDDAGAAGSLTQLMGRAVTPSYASPEQIAGRPVSVATDVYSLGVVLYELLTGELPYRLGRQTAAALEEAILSAAVLPASVRVADARIARRLRGDLDTILAKALRADAERRYTSVESMAADIRRHLEGLPVEARPPGLWYRTRKFLGRNRVPVLAGGVIAAALVAGLSVALWQARDAARERELAYARLAQTEAVSEFMNAVLTENVQYDERITLKNLVERSESLAQAAVNPTERAVAANAVANWFLAYGDHGKAERLLSRTLASLPGDFDWRLTLALVCQRAWAASLMGRTDAALQDIAQALEAARGDETTISRCLHMRAIVRRHTNDSAGALADMQEAIRLFDGVAGGSAATRAALLAELGYADSLSGRARQAEEHYTAALALLQSIGRGESHVAVLVRNHWAAALVRSGAPGRALSLLDEAQDVVTRRAPSAGPSATLWGSRGQALLALARLDEADAAYDQMIEAAERDGDANLRAAGLTGRAAVAQQRGATETVQPLLDAAAAAMASDRVPPQGATALAHRYLQAVVWQQRGQSREAMAALTGLIEGMQQSGLRVDTLVQALIARSGIALAQGRAAEALDDAERALAMAQEVQGGMAFSSVTGQAWLALAEARRAGAAPVAAPAAFAQAVQHFTRTLGVTHPLAQQAQRLSGGAPPLR